MAECSRDGSRGNGELKVVGQDQKRIDALEKVTGRAKFTADFHEGHLLHAKVVRSPHAHATIKGIDASAAEGYPGVRAVVIPQDSPATRIGFVVCADRQMLPVDGRVRYVGEPVAIVVADTPEIAEEAMALVKVEYEVLPAVFDAEEAMKPDCSVVLHPDKNSYGAASTQLGCRLEREIPNIIVSLNIDHGNVDVGFAEAEVIVENRYAFDGGSQCRMEPYVVDAWVDGDGVLTVRSARSGIWRCHGWLCKVFGLPSAKIRVLSPYVGGHFGGKGTPLTEALTLLAAIKAKRPVRLQYTREEEFFDTCVRPRIVIYVKDGAKKDGTLVARETKLIIDAGAYGAGGGTMSPISAHLGVVSCYKIPHWRSEAHAVYTNNIPTGTMRGVEAPQGNWAIESNMDCLAHALGMDPLALRLKNVVAEGDVSALGQVLEHVHDNPRRCLEETAALIGWAERPEQRTGRVRRGKGIAMCNWVAAPWWPSAATVKMLRDGSVEARIGTDEVGQGLLTLITQIVAEQFRLPVEKVRVVRGDTLYAPYDWATVGSRSTWMTGNAVLKACHDVKHKLIQLAAKKLEASPEDLVIADGRVYHKELPSRPVLIGQLFQFDFAHEVGEIIGHGAHEEDWTDIDSRTGYSPRAMPVWSYLAFGVEVEVNIATGEIKVLRARSAADVGQPINWKMCEGQIEGGMAMGTGCALYERFELAEGKPLNLSFVTYRMPTALEVPTGESVTSVSVGTPHPNGPYGAKPLGEMTLVPYLAAVGNAVYDAIGVRLTDAPLTRERVLHALGVLAREE